MATTLSSALLVTMVACGQGVETSNDAFADAFLLTGTTNTASRSSVGATKEPFEPNHAGNAGGASLWWQWTAPSSGSAIVSTDGSNFDTVLGVYTGGTVSNLTVVASDDDAGIGAASQVIFNAVAGTTYRLAVDGFGGRVGMVVVNLRLLPPAPNDMFANRTMIVGTSNTVFGNNFGASKETGEPNHAGGVGGRSIWWTWTAPTEATAILTAPGGFLLAVYTGDSITNLNPVAAGSFDGLAFSAVVGVSYHIAVDSWNGTGGEIELQLMTIAPPANDRFVSAIDLEGTPIMQPGLLHGATLEPDEPEHEGRSASVWYRWTAPKTGRVVIGPSYGVEVYTGVALNTLIPVSIYREPDRLFEALAGAEYSIAVTGSPLSPWEFTLALRYSPTNDDFANAIPLAGISSRVEAGADGATLEPGEYPFQGGTVWWSFVAPAAGSVTITKDSSDNPRIIVAQGNAVSSFDTVATDRRGDPPISVAVCQILFGVASNELYYVSASGYSSFGFQVEFKPAPVNPPPPNDSFSQRIPIDHPAGESGGTTAGAGTESGEPPHGFSSVWWSWTAPESGPVIVTTSGSRIDTSLHIYTGSSVSNLSPVASNYDAYYWGLLTGPASDPLSRAKFAAEAGETYSIAVVGQGGSGEVRVNVESLAIEDILSIERAVLPDKAVDFSADLKISNFRSASTGPLRVRLLSRPAYTYRQDVFFRCPEDWPVFNAPDEELDALELPVPGRVSPTNSVVVTISGRCSPPFSFGSWAVARGVIAFLEEEVGGQWHPRDSRLILNGDWPGVGGFSGGPGGGVVNIVSSVVAGADHPGLLSIRPGPPAALRLGGAWRVSPTNYGDKGELRFYTNFTSASLKLPVSSTNFAIEVRDLPGFHVPESRTVSVQPNSTVALDLLYLVAPPRLSLDASGGLAITGTEGTAYSIERSSWLTDPTGWSPVSTATLLSGTNWISGTLPSQTGSNRFYRAKWVTE